jgi:hypothetical protein
MPEVVLFVRFNKNQKTVLVFSNVFSNPTPITYVKSNVSMEEMIDFVRNQLVAVKEKAKMSVRKWAMGVTKVLPPDTNNEFWRVETRHSESDEVLLDHYVYTEGFAQEYLMVHQKHHDVLVNEYEEFEKIIAMIDERKIVYRMDTVK